MGERKRNPCLTCAHRPTGPIRHTLDLCGYVGFQRPWTPEGQEFFARPVGASCPGYRRVRLKVIG